MYQVQDQSIRPLTTAHLAQTMSLLVLSNQELRDRVLSEISSNPALELLEERVCPGCHRVLKGTSQCPVCSRGNQDGEPIVFLSPRDSIRPTRRNALDDQPMDREPAAPEDLSLHVLQQLAGDLKPEDRSLALYILASLDDDGFLVDHPAIIAQATRTPFPRVQRVLALISSADPVGLATEGPKQALLVQLAQYPAEDMMADLARRMLTQTFSELGRREYDKIAHELGTNVRQIHAATEFIQENLNPYPSRAYWGSGREAAQGDPNVYHTPDIMISRSPSDPFGPLMVEIFSAISGWLRVNPLFKQAMDSKNGEQNEEWSEHLEKANLFVKCLQQRNNTMRKLMELLVTSQREFILDGPRYLVPMTRAQLADEIGVHESTISRAVANKSVALPNGKIIPLAKFFDRSLSVRDQIKEIVENELKPLTDDEIASMLQEEGIKIARRTVAKYRAIEGILPARLRGTNKLSQAA
jgi:RNA polymerase sigma-54 factor